MHLFHLKGMKSAAFFEFTLPNKYIDVKVKKSENSLVVS